MVRSKSCCVGSCRRRAAETISLHSFPKEPDICAEWKLFCGLPVEADVKNKYVCSSHFEVACFKNAVAVSKRLISASVPTISTAEPNELLQVEYLQEEYGNVQCHLDAPYVASTVSSNPGTNDSCVSNPNEKSSGTVLGYFLANATLGRSVQTNIVCEAVRRLIKAGFHPVALVMDQHATNQKMAEELGVTLENPTFTVDSTEVVCLYDNPHLFKSIRNNLSNKNILLDEIISFKYIRDLYSKDVENVPRIVPGLSKKAITLPPFSKMNVGIATKTLSRTTAKGLIFYVEEEILPKEALATATFCETMDNLFDCFNSRFEKDLAKPLRAAISDTSEHWQFLDEAKQTLSRMMFVPETSFDVSTAIQEAHDCLTSNQRDPPSISGYIQNINAVSILWDIVKAYGFTYLCMNTVCQDPLENEFAAVRRACGNNDAPNAFQFGAAIKLASIKHSITEKLDTNHTTNCEEEQLNNYLDDTCVTEEQMEKDPLDNAGEFLERPFQPIEPDEGTPDAPEMNALVYIIGFVLSKLPHVQCRDNINLIHSDVQTKDSNYRFSRLKHQLKAPNFQYPNTVALEIGISLLVAFKQKFFGFLGESRRMVKMRLKEYVWYNEYKSFICAICFENFCNRLLNTLIKGQLTKIRSKCNKARHGFKRNSKARRMNLEEKLPKKSNGRRKLSVLAKRKFQKTHKVIKKVSTKSQCSHNPNLVIPASTTLKLNEGERDNNDAELHNMQAVIEELEKVVNTFPAVENIHVENRDCHCLSISDILSTFSSFEEELKQMYNRYKHLTERQLVSINDLVSWQEIANIITDDQRYHMLIFLEENIVPDDEKDLTIDFTSSVLLYEWALRIFMKHHGFADRASAIDHIRLQDLQNFSN